MPHIESNPGHNFALLYLASLFIRRFGTKDELRNAIIDAKGRNARVTAYRFNTQAQEWAEMEIHDV